MKAEFYSPELEQEFKELKEEFKEFNLLGFIGFTITFLIVMFDIFSVVLLLS